MSFGYAAAERAAIERTYEDTAIISRTTPQTGTNKITKSVPSVVYSNIICALSKGSDKSEQTKAQNKIDYDAVVFSPPDFLILPGDKIALKRFGRSDPNSSIVYNFEVVGRPSIYESAKMEHNRLNEHLERDHGQIVVKNHKND
ncbi:hypothetical protein SDC9_75301 [bioreactor metagenome]|uniref:Uncharacterized protein n=1 Tax=bioreactor metagenome TaxID=1076179 RepID=A0A644YQL9_9ZZZZ|nr:hypothetical protein [Oscillospiraceae bacterium]